MRLIDADALLEKVQYRIPVDNHNGEVIKGCVDITRRLIEAEKTIGPADLVPKGTWNGEGDGYADGEIVLDVWYCSECNHCIDDGTDDPDLLPNFCPSCGADMREDFDAT